MQTFTLIGSNVHFLKDPLHHNNRQEKRTDISNRLGDLDSQKSDGRCQNQQRRNQEESLTADGDYGGADTVANGLGHHISHNNHTL